MFMKRIILLSLLGQMMCLSMYSQVRMRDIFASAPDSVFPLLTRNNRLDCIDFIENKMPARVKNRLDNVVELLKLGDAYLQLRTSERSIVEMRLLSDSLMCLIHTYMGPAADSRVSFYDTAWKPVATELPCPTVGDYWQAVPDSLAREADSARRALADLTLTHIKASEAEPTLTFTLQTSELEKKEREVAQHYVQPLVYRWDGKSFVRQQK